jgi:hypothetical protein
MVPEKHLALSAQGWLEAQELPSALLGGTPPPGEIGDAAQVRRLLTPQRFHYCMPQISRIAASGRSSLLQGGYLVLADRYPPGLLTWPAVARPTGCEISTGCSGARPILFPRAPGCS